MGVATGARNLYQIRLVVETCPKQRFEIWEVARQAGLKGAWRTSLNFHIKALNEIGVEENEEMVHFLKRSLHFGGTRFLSFGDPTLTSLACLTVSLFTYHCV